MRIEHIGDATLYLGDCLDILPTLGKVDVVVTDPPYGISHITSYGATWQNTHIANDEDTTTRDIALSGFQNVAAFGTWKTAPIVNTKGALVWDKGPNSGMGDLRFPWKGSWELIYIRGSIWRGFRDEGILRGHSMITWESKGRTHPHEKPLSILQYILQKCPDAETILDPFMGSGTTGVACANLGRKFIGIEIEPKYFDIACRRIEEAYRQPRLFEDEKPQYKQAEMEI